jgi:hypothetical protein
MPARPVVLAITLFWMATNGWLFYRDLWPRLRPGQPPPYTIDLADEALGKGPKISWNVFRANRGRQLAGAASGEHQPADKKLGDAETWISYRESDDTFELHSKVKRLEWGPLGLFYIESLDLSSMYRVSRDGRLRELVADATISGRGSGPFKGLRGWAQARVEGKVAHGKFTAQASVNLNGTTIALPLEPVEVSSQGSVLNPLHPINRVRGLQKGQHWRMPLVNPLNDSLMALLKKDPGAELLLRGRGGLEILQAEVLPDTKLLSWKGHEVPCLVIEYRGEDLLARTWVRAEDGVVLRQELTFWGDQVILERDSAAEVF